MPSLSAILSYAEMNCGDQQKVIERIQALAIANALSDEQLSQ